MLLRDMSYTNLKLKLYPPHAVGVASKKHLTTPTVSF